MVEDPKPISPPPSAPSSTSEPVVKRAPDAGVATPLPSTVRPMAYEGAPSTSEIAGTVDEKQGLRFDDRAGENVIVVSRESRTTTPTSDREDAQTTSTLHINHFQRASEQEPWRLVTGRQESVENCSFDLTSAVYFGPWSLSDLDEDGMAEVTMAYSTGCRSDVSPISHKVLMIEDGERYSLHGTTTIQGAETPEAPMADPQFEQAPEAFLDHAKKAWAATHVEGISE